jgi:hypothetical protein
MLLVDNMLTHTTPLLCFVFLSDGEPVYTFSEWVEEDMGIARVGGDATLLPNGDVVIVNGGQVSMGLRADCQLLH